MRQAFILMLTVIALMVIGYHLYLDGHYQKFNINGNHFLIERDRELQRRNRTLQHLVRVRQRLDHLVKHLKHKYPQDQFIQRMEDRFDGTLLRENNYNHKKPKESSYTINKGDLMVLCLRRPDGSLTDINTLTYVAIHELAHIYSSSVHHTQEFWTNMKFLVNEAHKIGIYKKVNYSQNPVKYCGLTIASNIPNHH